MIEYFSFEASQKTNDAVVHSISIFFSVSSY